MTYKCNKCNKTVQIAHKASHIRWCLINLNKHGKEKQCTKCGVSFCLISSKDRKRTCSAECANSITPDVRERISIKRKEYLKNNPDLHVWKRNTKFKSIPCENVKKYLRDKNISFIEEHIPLKTNSYSIDIAFPNIKLGIEINGNQHYEKSGVLKPYYQKRHDAIEADGWALREIHYSRCFHDESISKIINFDLPDDSNVQIELIKKYKEKNQTRNALLKQRC